MAEFGQRLTEIKQRTHAIRIIFTKYKNFVFQHAGVAEFGKRT